MGLLGKGRPLFLLLFSSSYSLLIQFCWKNKISDLYEEVNEAHGALENLGQCRGTSGVDCPH